MLNFMGFLKLSTGPRPNISPSAASDVYFSLPWIQCSAPPVIIHIIISHNFNVFSNKMEHWGRLKLRPRLKRKIKAGLRGPCFISEFHYFNMACPEVKHASSAVICPGVCRFMSRCNGSNTLQQVTSRRCSEPYLPLLTTNIKWYPFI